MLTLYHHGSSVCAAKVRLALDEKGLEWDGKYVDILKGEQFDPAFQKLNPKSLVPVLVDGNNVITESTVINEYLEQVYPDNPIFPQDPQLRANARLWTKAVDEDIHPACAALTFITSHRHTLFKLGPEKLEEFLSSTPDISITPFWKKQKRQYVEQAFDAPGAAEMVLIYDRYIQKIDEALAHTTWLVGDEFGVADISVIPYVNRLEMLGMSGLWENGRLPRLADWWQRATARPSFRRQVLDWIPGSLETDLRTFGPRSWGEVSRIVGIAA